MYAPGYTVMTKPPARSGGWSTGLCDCFSDFCGCLMGCCCPCVLYGDNAAALGGSCFLNCFLYFCFGNMCPCCFVGNRQKLRANHNLAPEPCSDCCVMCWCSPCAICQEARVIHKHGAMPQMMQVVAPQLAAPQQQQMMMIATTPAYRHV